MVRHLKHLFTGGLLVAAGVFFVLTAAGRLSGNIGWLEFRDQLIAVKPNLSDYPLYQVIDQTAIQSSQVWLQRAMALNSSDRVARWNLGRVALAAGEAGSATEWLKPLAADARFNLLLQMDRLSALSLTGHVDEVLKSLQEQSIPEPQRPRFVRTAVESQVVDDLQTGRPEDLNRAWQLRPTDLYLNYRLWKQAQAAGDSAMAESHRQAIVRFAREAVDPTDERLIDYAASVARDIRANGLWDRTQLQRVVAFWIWRQPAAIQVEQLLRDLASDYPNEPEWTSYLTELRDRQTGQMIRQADLSQLNDERANRQFTAEQLGVVGDRIELGPELVENGTFEDWTTTGPNAWRLNHYLGRKGDGGIYVAGQDPFDDNHPAARIDALWEGQLQGGTTSFSEYVGHEFPIESQYYLVTLTYRANFIPGYMQLFIGEYSRQNGYVLIDQLLPSTQGLLQVTRWVVGGPAAPVQVVPVVRNGGGGQLWIDSLSVRPVSVHNPNTVP